MRPLPLEVFINGTRAGPWLLLDVRGQLYATEEAFTEWRVNRAVQAPPLSHLGQTWYPLSSVEGFSAQFNPAAQSVELKFAPTAFAITHLAQPVDERPAITPPLTAAFLNYDASYTYTGSRGGSSAQDLGAVAELGLTGRHGVLTQTMVGRNLNNDPALPERSLTRLETTFSRDFPDRNTSLRLGDSATRTGSWGRSVYFGGVQLGTNFALTPGFITQPIPIIAGQSSAPSTVELYVNDALRQTSKVPSGPFTIENVPPLTGTGQARIVVRDVLGRETVIVQDLFTHAALLKQGLSDWGAQAGAVRRNLGLDSADYGEGFASGLFRHGLSDDLTVEAQSEASTGVRGAGLGLSKNLFGRALGQAALAVSQSDQQGSGRLWMLGAEHLSLRHGFTAHFEGASSEYRRLGQTDVLAPLRQQTLLSYTYFEPDSGQTAFAFANVRNQLAGSVKTFTAAHSLRLGERSTLSFTATRIYGGANGVSVGATLLVPLDARTSVSANVTHRDGQTDGYAAASRPLGTESGLGWRALTGRRAGAAYGEGGVYYQGGHGLVTADASASDNAQVLRLGAQGGLVAVDGAFFASRRLTDSFALVEVPGYADVGVGFQSTVLTRTDANGKALVPRLMPYRRNSIRLDPNELPISAELDTIEMIAVPPARAAVKVAFPVRSGRGALVTVKLEDGETAPAGAEIVLLADGKDFFVARRGEAFITGLQARNRLRLKWNGQACEFEVELPDTNADEIPRLGPFLCAGVTR